MNPEQISNALVAFIQADDTAQKQALLDQHPELLTEAAQEIGKALLQQTDDEDVQQFITAHLLILQTCHEHDVNVESAFEALQQTNVGASGNSPLPNELMPLSKNSLSQTHGANQNKSLNKIPSC